jgi:pyruvate,water dikinase
MVAQSNILWFRDLHLRDVAVVGGKNASLGELYSVLSRQGIRVPNGFALTAEAYRDALTAAGAWDKLHQLLDGLDKAAWMSLQSALPKHARSSSKPPAPTACGKR